MNSFEDLTLVAVYLSEGKFASREWNYYITQREGNFLYDFKLGDPVDPTFGEKCELMVENTAKRNNFVYSFQRKNGQWKVVSWTPRDMPPQGMSADGVIPEAMSDSFNNIFARYYQEVESREVPDKLKTKSGTSEAEAAEIPAVASGKDMVLDMKVIDHLDSDLTDEVLNLAGTDGVEFSQIQKKATELVVRQLERNKEAAQFLNEQMKEKDQMIKENDKIIQGLNETIDLNQKVFESELKEAQAKSDSAGSKFDKKLFLEKVWSELTLRLAFPSEEKEKAIFAYFEGLVDTWMPIALEGVQMVGGQVAKPEDKVQAEAEDVSVSKEVPSTQKMDITRKNFYNDLQEYEIYPGETQLLKNLCEGDLNLSEMVLGYVRKYGRDSVKDWWNKYQEYSSDIDF